MDRFISHRNPIIKYECMFFDFISFLRLKKVSWIALLATTTP